MNKLLCIYVIKDICLKIQHSCFANSLPSSRLSSYSYFCVPGEWWPDQVHGSKKEDEYFFTVNNLNLDLKNTLDT